MTGTVVWFTGPPASGKSTLAVGLAGRLRQRGAAPLILDGDEVRTALVPAPGYDDLARDHFYLTLANLAALAARQGLIVLVAATAHRRRWRDQARALAPRFIEVHVATPPEECRRRDPKGLYAAGRPSLPGADLAYEPPAVPDVTAPHGNDPAVVDDLVAVLDRDRG